MSKKNSNNFFNDISKFASDAFSSAAHFKREVGEYIRTVVDSLVKKMNYATKDEMHLVERVVTQAKQDVADIKKILGLKEGGAKAKKPALKIKKAKTAVVKKESKPITKTTVKAIAKKVEKPVTSKKSKSAVAVKKQKTDK